MSEPQLSWSAPFESLKEGQRFESNDREVHEADVIAFCALSGDWHPQHWDARWALSSPFGERIAHGMLVLSLAVGLMPLDPKRVRALRRVSEVVFKRPVRLGERIAVIAEVAALKPVDASTGLVDLRLTVRNGEGALICRGGVQVLWAAQEAQGAAEPPQGGTEPVQGGTEPVQGGTEPVQGGTEPVQGSTEPVQGSTEPVQGSTEPAQGAAEPSYWSDAVPESEAASACLAVPI